MQELQEVISHGFLLQVDARQENERVVQGDCPVLRHQRHEWHLRLVPNIHATGVVQVDQLFLEDDGTGGGQPSPVCVCVCSALQQVGGVSTVRINPSFNKADTRHYLW